MYQNLLKLLNLHSIIFILKLTVDQSEYMFTQTHLHSIIFILKPLARNKCGVPSKLFTFYYIYIKTRPHLHKYENILYLHSIIFILKLY